MTLNAITLDEYFHLIVKPQPTQKELTMFDKTKLFFNEQLQNFKTLWYKPFEAEDTVPKLEDYWAFEMRTNEWIDECDEYHPIKHTLTIEPHEGTWMEVLDKVIDEMEKHYGYSIKEQVYYSVVFPINEKDHEGKELAGYGRCLNDGVLQQLLLAFPQAYYWTDAGDIYK